MERKERKKGVDGVVEEDQQVGSRIKDLKFKI